MPNNDTVMDIKDITNKSHKHEKNSIFSIVRNGLYEQYLKLITNIDVNCQNEYGQNLLQEAIVSNMDEIAIDLVKNSCGIVLDFCK